MRVISILAVLVVLLLAACDADTTSSPAASGDPSMEASPGESGEAGVYTIVGNEYSFANVPDAVPVGSSLTFDNQGEEAHEMVVLRRNDDSTLSFEEIANLDSEAAQNEVTIVGLATAPAGEAGADSVTLTEPGDYALICFFPMVENTTNESPIPLRQHFMEGMLATFTVTGEAEMDMSPDASADENESEEAQASPSS